MKVMEMMRKAFGLFVVVLLLCVVLPRRLARTPGSSRPSCGLRRRVSRLQANAHRSLAEKIQGLANVDIDIKVMNTAEQMAAAFADPKFGEGYDVIIYDICFGEKWKDGDYDGALRVANAGKPAVIIHCSCHTYRPPRDAKAPDLKEREAIADAKWHAFVGMDTRVHDKFQPFATEKADKDNPIMKSFPDDWKTPGDELYNTVKMMPTATPLLTAEVSRVEREGSYRGLGQSLRKARVFGTTLGHDMKTGADPAYHKLLAYGLLWACDKLDADGKPAAGYGPK